MYLLLIEAFHLRDSSRGNLTIVLRGIYQTVHFSTVSKREKLEETYISNTMELAKQ
jgi:hypothetical protein